MTVTLMARPVAKKVSDSAQPLKKMLTAYLAIESRVARIKARVAELTGNMDGSGAHREQRV